MVLRWRASRARAPLKSSTNWSVCWKMTPYSRPKLSDLCTLSQTKLLENQCKMGLTGLHDSPARVQNSLFIVWLSRVVFERRPPSFIRYEGRFFGTFWSGIGYGFRGNYGNLWTYLSFQFQINKKETDNQSDFEMNSYEFFCWRSNLSSLSNFKFDNGSGF